MGEKRQEKREEMNTKSREIDGKRGNLNTFREWLTALQGGRLPLLQGFPAMAITSRLELVRGTWEVFTVGEHADRDRRGKILGIPVGYGPGIGDGARGCRSCCGLSGKTCVNTDRENGIDSGSMKG